MISLARSYVFGIFCSSTNSKYHIEACICTMNIKGTVCNLSVNASVNNYSALKQLEFAITAKLTDEFLK